jgi:hypothetical protein
MCSEGWLVSICSVSSTCSRRYYHYHWGIQTTPHQLFYFYKTWRTVCSVIDRDLRSDPNDRSLLMQERIRFVARCRSLSTDARSNTRTKSGLSVSRLIQSSAFGFSSDPVALSGPIMWFQQRWRLHKHPSSCQQPGYPH